MTKKIPHLKILVTGSNGFIGKNLCIRLKEIPNFDVLSFVRGDTDKILKKLVNKADAIVHLAGENRTDDIDSFNLINAGLTKKLCKAIEDEQRNIPLILASSTQAKSNNAYGKSKLAAEEIVKDFTKKNNNTSIIYRLPGVFGKWCKPNYNSVVATFCFNIARDIEIEINDESKEVELLYIDDLTNYIISDLVDPLPGLSWKNFDKSYSISIGELAKKIISFKESRKYLTIETVGKSITRALYSTFISYYPKNSFLYDIPNHPDERGDFVEILKTKDSGQFSFFTIKPGVTRGSHYHHTKTEKFIMVKGRAKLEFRHLISNETHEIDISDKKAQIVDTIPGWIHNITNTGKNDAVILLWANEIFDRENPDTIPEEV